MKTSMFPGMNAFYENTVDVNKPLSRQYVNIFEGVINIIELGLQVFTICTIRLYENKITSDGDKYIKKVKPITNILRDRFIAPSLGTHLEIARGCFHLVDNDAPHELIKMKERLGETLLLGAIGLLIDDLERIFEKLGKQEEEDLYNNKSGKAQVVGREQSKKPFLTGILAQFVSFRNDSAHLATLRSLIEDNEMSLRLNINTWRQGFDELLDYFEPILQVTYRLKLINRIETYKEEKKIQVVERTYFNEKIEEAYEFVSLDEWIENQWDTASEIIMHNSGGKIVLDLYPFIIINDIEKDLSFYKKTKASGYQYFGITTNKVFLKGTKKKFNHAIFRSFQLASQQALFWTETFPSYNTAGLIKANIPSQGKTAFVGRKKQIDKIKDEIIEIPNQNGIVYGPGGVGKTALIIELSKKMFQESDLNEVPFSNIIWAMAKTNYFNPLLNSIEDKPKQFSSLENVLHVILKFFDYEHVQEYSMEQLQELTLDLLQENTVLLILDNFETITKSEGEVIIRFFEVNVKKHLKQSPTYFKLILTSRELIPSGFHQIKLEGLEFKDSKLLMKNLFLPYANKHSELTDGQLRLIHDATLGIPIVIVHCFGQLYEFNQPFETILSRLSNETNEVIKFSYSEIFTLFKKDDTFLQVLILIEVLHEPISIRQISDILQLQENEIIRRVPLLLNFQCIERINVGIEEKYVINTQIGLLIKTLIRDNEEITLEIRHKVARNLTLDRRMDYSMEEFEIIEVFKRYIRENRFLEAENFLKSQIINRPNSQLLRFNFAEYLRDYQKDLLGAIDILQTLNDESKAQGIQDPNILLSLASCYTSFEFANYEKAKIYYSELLRISRDELIIYQVAEFYIRWSTAIKNKRESDPIQEMYRRVQYKELAIEGIKMLGTLKSKKNEHKYHYLFALGYFNKWDNNRSLEHIEKAIGYAKLDPESFLVYTKFKKMITKGNV